MNQLLFTAQDMGMTNGDYVFFTYALIAADIVNPWLTYNLSGTELDYRIQASYAVKMVNIACAGRVVIRIDTITKLVRWHKVKITSGAEIYLYI